MKILASLLLLLPFAAAREYHCDSTSPEALTTSGSVTFSSLACQKLPSRDTVTPITVSAIRIDLKAQDIRVTPLASADPLAPLKGIDQMASDYAPRRIIAGINGGYFWRTDITPFWLDDVCRGKTRADAESPPSPDAPNNGIHDGQLVIDGKYFGSNCDKWGFSRPAIVYTPSSLSSEDWDMALQSRGEQLAGVYSALAAGPNLVSLNATTLEPYVDIPEDDDNINIYEHASNTAVGLIFDLKTGKSKEMIFVTVDGSECGPFDQSCGINSKNLAHLMLDAFNVHKSISMDQGGSTTLWIEGKGVVSNGGSGARAVANGLFIELV
jgi:hypothetical protein